MEQHYAIVLRTVNYKDSDKLLTLFSRKSGPITATARGVRKAKSRLKPAAQLFCCGEFEFQPAKGGRLILTGVNIRQEFYQIQNTYEKYTAACVMLEFTEKLLHNTDEYERLFVALIYSLFALEKDMLGGAGALAYFFAQALEIVGMFPSLDHCTHCHKSDAALPFWADGGLLCADCAAQTKNQKITPQTVTDMEVLRRVRPQNVEAAGMDPHRSKAALDLLLQYISSGLGIHLKTLKFLLI